MPLDERITELLNELEEHAKDPTVSREELAQIIFKFNKELEHRLDDINLENQDAMELMEGS